MDKPRIEPPTGRLSATAASGAALLAGGDLPEFIFADALEASGGAGAFVEVLLRR